MVKIDQQLDTYTIKMMEKKIREIHNQKLGGFPSIQFPAPNLISFYENDSKIKTVTISCIAALNKRCHKNSRRSSIESKDWMNSEDTKYDDPESIYKLPAMDEYYGELNYVHKYDNINKYDKINNLDLANNDKQFDNLAEAEQWFDDMIHKSLYIADTDDADDDDNIMDGDEDEKDFRNRKKLRYKLFNEWDSINITKLGNDNQVIEELFNSTEFTGHVSDYWLTLIAFTGFAAHRTQKIEASDDHPGCYYINDVSFLSAYNVRAGYRKYGAIAYFDNKYCITKIYLSYSGKTYTPNSYIKREWEHAKWCWKVCVFCIFRYDI